MTARALEVSHNVIALRNPRTELPQMFRQRAERLHDELNDHPRDEHSRVEPSEATP